jgi:aspartate/methionine/tyrosine aminotransferase
MKLAARMSRLSGEGAFEVLQRARALEAQGRHIIHLEIGEPDFETPEHAREAGKSAIDNGYTHYGPTPGDPDLRDAIARHISATRGVPYERENVVVVPGGKPMIFFPIQAFVEEGCEVICPNPGYPTYESVVRFCGGTPVPIPLVEERSFSFDLDVFAASLSERTRMVILNSPQNPTGGVIPAEDMRAMAAMLRDRDIVVLSDEIYSRIYYGDPPLSIASCEGMAEKTIILDGFSKIYSMTGWRLGYGVMPKWMVEPISLMMVNTNSCTATFTQRAGIAALEGPQDPCHHMVREFRKRRDLFVMALNRIPGVRCQVPGGAFYAFPNITGTGWKSRDLAAALLDQAGVACLSGTAFGSFGEGYLRFSMANSLDNLLEAANRIERFLSA